MNNFANVVRNNNYDNLTRTENRGVALSSTQSPLLDLFATVGALRGGEHLDVRSLFLSAMEEDKLLATKLAFYARNIRGGLGERDTFRKLIVVLANNYPEIMRKNISLIPHFGRWDDLYVLVDTPCETDMWELIREQLRSDMDSLNEGNSVSLLAKWLKSVNTSSAESRELGKMTAKALGLTEKAYRKLLARLRKHIGIVEKKMSKNRWTDIEYENVPSLAMKNYMSAFYRHDEDGFRKYIDSVEKGEKEIKASTLYPYDILMKANITHDYFGWGKNVNFEMEYNPVLEQQWKALPNYVKGENNVLVMADTSASMESNNGRPLATSIGLAIYFAERNKGAYKDLFLTFSERPSFVTLKGDTLKEKVENIEAIVENTNLEKAFNLILEVALENNVPQEEMPKALIVITDMQFDMAVEDASQTKTLHKKMKKLYEREGYQLPTVIYWNVEQRRTAFQVDKNAVNVMLISGQSTSTFRDILANIGRTPYDFMVETLNNPMYDCVKV